ncbi:MAG: hypothetical protein C4583_17015 [Anaerolineaceae bacterium]|nr:MAG: hypothetical protein C4583_17015 [Anaerolineaceae bacterium]
MEKAHLPSPAEHPSYQKHRRELWAKILVPMLLAVAAIIAIATLTGIAAFQEESEVGRWAAISTIWIVIPIMGVGLLALILFAALIYGMAKLLSLIPPYTGHAQRFAWRVEGYVRRGADASIKPILAMEGFTATIKRLIGIK